MPTKKEFTYEVLGGFLKDNGTMNVEYLNESIYDFVFNASTKEGQRCYFEIPNKRRSLEALTNMCVHGFICHQLENLGHHGYYADNRQILKFCNEHGGDGWNTFNQMLEELREAQENWEG